MIKNINKLKNFGIFSDCQPGSCAEDFVKFNLIYGWNGSGKSTLATLFEAIEKHEMPDPKKIKLPEFSVNFIEGLPVTQDNITTSNKKLSTFNQSFVKENIDWDNSVKSILLVAKEKIIERKKLESLTKQYDDADKKYTKEVQDIEKVKVEVSKFLTASAKRTKQSLQVIDTKDSRYLNYNKSKIETFINSNKDSVKSKNSLLKDDDLVEATKAAKPDPKPAVSMSIDTLCEETINNIKTRIEKLLSTSVTSKIIERLKANSDIQNWVLAGFNLHEKHESKICEFCGNNISAERTKEIEQHFSNEYKKFKADLEKTDQWLESQYIKIDSLPSADSLYDEFKENYTSAGDFLNKSVLIVNEAIAVWHNLLKKKKENPFSKNLSITSIHIDLITQYNDSVKKVMNVVDTHNNKSKNFEEETKKSKTVLELHYAASEVKAFNYFTKKDDIAYREKENNKLKVKTDAVGEKIKDIEDILSNETIGADQFNESLHKFIGRSELSLKFNHGLKGYEIIRNDSGGHDSNLSEGEKTAIAFVYFITKLKEKGNNISDTIVVIDDPVSSFDSNHLFHAYSYLRMHCTNVKQLFVLTHNFTFFKLVRDWLSKKNKKDNKTKEMIIKSNYYVIESTTGKPRKSYLTNADSSLKNYNSEYHYLFSRLHGYKKAERLSLDEAFLTANIARKLLESFFSFKFPKSRNNFRQLCDCAAKGCEKTTEDITEKIYRFINKYSHNTSIEINDDGSENLLGESYNIINDIFVWISEVDHVHYHEMEEVVSG